MSIYVLIIYELVTPARGYGICIGDMAQCKSHHAEGLVNPKVLAKNP
jgi:hypothetical protein